MRRKILASVAILGLLAGCGSNAPDVMTPPDTSAAVSSVSVSETQTPSVEEETLKDEEEIFVFKDEMPDIEFFKPHDESFEFNYDWETDMCVFTDGERIDFVLPDTEIVSIVKYDEDSYLVSTCAGRGTGFYNMELYILKAPEYEPEIILSVDDINKVFEDRLEYVYHEDYGNVMLTIDGTYQKSLFLKKFLEEHNTQFTGLYWGDIFRIEIYEGKPWLYALAAVTSTEWLSNFDYTFSVTAPITIEDNRCTIGEINAEIVDYSIRDEKTYEKYEEEEIPFFSCYRDINHDGCKDKIVSSVLRTPDYSGNLTKAIDSLSNLAFVRIFGGVYYYTDPPEQHFLEFAHYEQAFDSSHASEGQLYVTTVDGADYLVKTSFWAGQGVRTYMYEVFFGDFERIYVMDSFYAECEYDEPFPDEDLFFEGLGKWLNDSSVLLMSSDIDTDPVLMYSTCDNIVSPEAYLSKKYK